MHFNVSCIIVKVQAALIIVLICRINCSLVSVNDPTKEITDDKSNKQEYIETSLSIDQVCLLSAWSLEYLEHH